jgi:hypothetical protein
MLRSDFFAVCEDVFRRPRGMVSEETMPLESVQDRYSLVAARSLHKN